ncbi:uncharacterized protein LOC131892441 isoform X2 [Tigriopus californicus]|uniref:uncharacterized protein LOC131892441 isoform X2 n=1 Tax=Tigriopus californicus TaxID=6832 RepID=UPI0027DAA5F8|nr:uncharacterized protein LOC131892441 isoform X2 [Tigriopus californicus]
MWFLTRTWISQTRLLTHSTQLPREDTDFKRRFSATTRETLVMVNISTQLVRALTSVLLLAISFQGITCFPSSLETDLLMGQPEMTKRVMLPVSKFAFLPDKLQLDLGQEGGAGPANQPKRGRDNKRHQLNSPNRRPYSLYDYVYGRQSLPPQGIRLLFPDVFH